MSELKAFNSERIYWAVEQVERGAGDIDELHLDDNLFYIKADADKLIEELKHQRDGAFGLANAGLTMDDLSQMAKNDIDRQKYKRCLGNAWLCKNLSKAYAWFASTHRGWKANTACDMKIELWRKWARRWMELAKNFNGKKTVWKPKRAVASG